MATKTCPNGHKYDSTIYGDNCPFCPSESQKTKVANSLGDDFDMGGKTKVAGGNDMDEALTRPMTNPAFETEEPEEGGTVIRVVGQSDNAANAGRKIVGVLVSYSVNENGEVFKVLEGRTYIGRSKQNDISVPSDKNMSSKHLMILFREAEGRFWAIDQDSSNGTYINGEFVSDKVALKTNDIIVVGATKFIFLAIPQ